jgi:hypothetical protein
MIKTYCNNCFQDKEAERILEVLCLTCFTRTNEAVENATRENQDPSLARKAALESRSMHPMANKALPSSYFPRVGGMQ